MTPLLPRSLLARCVLQWRRLLIGPSESVAMFPVHLAALVVIVRVALSRRYEGWLRLIAGGTLGLYTPALFFIYSDRYQILAWLLTFLFSFFSIWHVLFPCLASRFPPLLFLVSPHPFFVVLSRPLPALPSR